MPRAKGVKQVAANRKALHDYFVLERFEAGVELFGTEVKSIRAGTVNLKDSFCTVKTGSCLPTASTSVPTSTAASTTATPTGRSVCSCTGGRSRSSTPARSRMG